MKNTLRKSCLLIALLFTSNNARCEQYNINSIGNLNKIVPNKHYMFDLIPVDKNNKHDQGIACINDIKSAVNKMTDKDVHKRMLAILSTKSNKIIDKDNKKIMLI